MNKELINKVIEHIEQNPEWHSQGTFISPREWHGPGGIQTDPPDDWTCGTTACIAGWAVLLSGWTPRILDHSVYRWAVSADEVEKDGVTGEIGEVAMRELCIPTNVADKLFYTMSNRTALDMLRQLAGQDE